MCGQNGRFSGRYQPPASSASDTAACKRRGAAALVVEVEREQARIPGRNRPHARRAEPRRRLCGRGAEGRLGDPPGRRLVLPPEEHERHVKRLGAHRTQVAAADEERVAPAGEPLARVLGEVERQEHPGAGPAHGCS